VRYIEDEGFVMMFPYTRYARLHKTYIKSEGFNYYSEYIKTSSIKCVNSKVTFLDKE
jgi:uncharacterized membrane protein YobD (UPF0266 family)